MHIIVGLLIAFVLVAIVAHHNKATRKCRWRADRTGDRDGLHRFICAGCGHEAFVPEDRPPNFCKAGQPH